MYSSSLKNGNWKTVVLYIFLFGLNLGLVSKDEHRAAAAHLEAADLERFPASAAQAQQAEAFFEKFFRTANDPRVSARLGAGVAVFGDTLVVGAPGDSEVGSEAGAVYIFQRDQGGPDNWGQVKKIVASNAENGAQFGNFVCDLPGHSDRGSIS